MSRIEKDELCFTDVEWYGVDKKGNIAVFCSGGQATVPEFVCANKEKYEQLIFLFDKFPKTSDTIICFNPSSVNHKPVEVAERFSEKGLYYFDSDDCSDREKNICSLNNYYTINSKPTLPINICDLPYEIQNLLQENKLPIDDFDKMIIFDV